MRQARNVGLDVVLLGEIGHKALHVGNHHVAILAVNDHGVAGECHDIAVIVGIEKPVVKLKIFNYLEHGIQLGLSLRHRVKNLVNLEPLFHSVLHERN